MIKSWLQKSGCLRKWNCILRSYAVSVHTFKVRPHHCRANPSSKAGQVESSGHSARTRLARGRGNEALSLPAVDLLCNWSRLLFLTDHNVLRLGWGRVRVKLSRLFTHSILFSTQNILHRQKYPFCQTTLTKCSGRKWTELNHVTFKYYTFRCEILFVRVDVS